MKFCPFCGAELLSPEVAFCTECGRPLPAAGSPETELEPEPKPVDKSRRPRKKAAPVRLKPEPRKKSGSSIEDAPKEKLSSRSGGEESSEALPEDDYDGYYNDVEPLDADATRPGLDREIIKKILFLVLGALLVVGLCVVLMTLL